MQTLPGCHSLYTETGLNLFTRIEHAQRVWTAPAELLEKLLLNKKGLTIDDLAGELGITRNAVQQHVAALENGGFLDKAQLTETGGRPGQVYILSRKGIELFPKQYSWFSELLLESLKSQLGGEGLETKMREIGQNLGKGLRSKLKGKDLAERIVEVAAMMKGIGFETVVTREDGQSLPSIKAHNCIYHHLAEEFEEVCQLDRSLLETLLEKKIEHEECIVRDGDTCRFRIKPE